MKTLTVLVNLLVLGLLSSCLNQSSLESEGHARNEGTQADWLIKNAQVYDGTGADPISADVLIVGGAIASIGKFEDSAATKIWDAKNLVLAPGFIDPHSHHDSKLMRKPSPSSVLAQGITTIVSGLDGGASTFGAPFKSIGHSMAVFEKNPAAINLAYFAPHDTYREIVMGADSKLAATPDEIAQMEAMLVRDLDAGALGLSTGLEYEPSLYSTTEEVISLAKVAAKYGGKYSSHIRSEDIGVYDAIDEVITIAREAKISANISHIKLAMYSLFGQSSQVIDRLNTAREEGLDISADIYPYDGWKAPMAILMPARDYSDRAAAEYALESIASPSSITITKYEGYPSYSGKSLTELAREQKIEPVDLLMKLLVRAEKENLKESVIGRNMGEQDIANFMEWPFTAITTDGGIDDSHPRGQGTFPRVLALYVRERGLMTLSEAIRKMTSLSARNLGIAERGSIKVGFAADLIIFDPMTIQDHATFEHSLQYSTGVSAVWVNGELVWNNGSATPARPGQIIRRSSRVH
jgi:N-acyl-D-amino-acid deacylase